MDNWCEVRGKASIHHGLDDGRCQAAFGVSYIRVPSGNSGSVRCGGGRGERGYVDHRLVPLGSAYEVTEGVANRLGGLHPRLNG
ncbi:hypothetical protein GCM10023347_22120 [Streptomyces chumphonensis]